MFEALAVLHWLRGFEQAIPGGRLRRVIQGSDWSAAGKGKPTICVLDFLRREPGQSGVARRDRYRNCDAAAADRRQQASRAVRDEDEHCPGRRLLQPLEESIRGVRQVEIVGGMDEGDASAAAVR